MELKYLPSLALLLLDLSLSCTSLFVPKFHRELNHIIAIVCLQKREGGNMNVGLTDFLLAQSPQVLRIQSS